MKNKKFNIICIIFKNLYYCAVFLTSLFTSIFSGRLLYYVVPCAFTYSGVSSYMSYERFLSTSLDERLFILFTNNIVDYEEVWRDVSPFVFYCVVFILSIIICIYMINKTYPIVFIRQKIVFIIVFIWKKIVARYKLSAIKKRRDERRKNKIEKKYEKLKNELNKYEEE